MIISLNIYTICIIILISTRVQQVKKELGNAQMIACLFILFKIVDNQCKLGIVLGVIKR